MLREIIRPTNEHYSLDIPKEYINKEIEIIILPLFDIKNNDQKTTPSKEFDPKIYYGASSSSKEDIDTYLVNAKSEWE